jgi:restriction system protein
MWIYTDTVRDVEAVCAAIDVGFCIFCRTKLRTIKEDHSVAPSGIDEIALTVQFCTMCGWWTKKRDVFTYFQGSFDVSHYADGAIGSLRELDISDQSLPIEEIRSYLAVKYDKRFNLDPWKFEEVVASVYKDFGYHTRVTARSGDGGIDVVLDGRNNSVIGVQVKRYRGKIQVEQIRAFVGALYLKKMTRGIFVTTSSFQSGADKVAKLSKSRGIPIELVDAERFYQALGIAQRATYKCVKDPSAPFWNTQLFSLGVDY